MQTSHRLSFSLQHSPPLLVNSLTGSQSVMCHKKFGGNHSNQNGVCRNNGMLSNFFFLNLRWLIDYFGNVYLKFHNTHTQYYKISWLTSVCFC